MPEDSYHLILASASPRRSQLLREMGLEFEVAAADINEQQKPGETALDYVTRMSVEKAQAIQNKRAESETERTAVLAADTIVHRQGVIFGKPSSYDNAREVWRSLSDSKHQVITSVTLLWDKHQVTDHSITEVQFSSISETQMQRYWDSGEPQDKAGAYAVQGLASAWVEKIDGSYSNVVGLPLFLVNQMLGKVNLNWL